MGTARPQANTLETSRSRSGPRLGGLPIELPLLTHCSTGHWIVAAEIFEVVCCQSQQLTSPNLPV